MDLELVDDLDLICKVCNQLLWLFWHVQSAVTCHCKSFLAFEYQSHLQATYLHLKLKSKSNLQSSEVKFSLWRNFYERGRCLAGSSKTAPRILIFSIVLGVEYLSLFEIHRYLCPPKSGHNNSFLVGFSLLYSPGTFFLYTWWVYKKSFYVYNWF